MVAAAEKNLPMFVPVWEDSTPATCTGSLHLGDVKNVHTVPPVIEYMIELAEFYTNRRPRRRSDSSRSAAASPAIFRSAWCDAPSGSEAHRGASVGILLPDQRLHDELRVVLRGGSEREITWGKLESTLPARHRVGRFDRRTADFSYVLGW